MTDQTPVGDRSEHIERTVTVRLKRKITRYQHQYVELRFTDDTVRGAWQIPPGTPVSANEIEAYACEEAETMDVFDKWVETNPDSFEELDSEIDDADPPLPKD